MSEEDNLNNEQESIIKDENIETSFRRNFVLPKRIKQIKLVIAIVVNLILGGTSLGLPIYFFINPTSDSIFIKLVGALLLILGVSLLVQFPFVIARTFYSKLLLGEDEIVIRNSFRTNTMKWKNVQDILIREKLSRDLASQELIVLDLVRFRAVSNAIFFLGDNYPKEEAKEIIDSIKNAFEYATKDSETKIEMQTERPSAQIRMVYLAKEKKGIF